MAAPAVALHHGDNEANDSILEDSALLGPQVDTQVNEESESIFTLTGPLSKLILYFMAIHFLLAFAEIILVAPLIRLFENSLCLKHYGFPQGGVEEVQCKIPEIQVPLATIRGWKSTLDALPGMIHGVGVCGNIVDL